MELGASVAADERGYRYHREQRGTKDPPGGRGAVLRLRLLTHDGELDAFLVVDENVPSRGWVLDTHGARDRACRPGRPRCARRLRHPLDRARGSPASGL